MSLRTSQNVIIEWTRLNLHWQLGMSGDASGDLGFGSGLNLGRLSANAAVAAAAAASLTGNSAVTASLASTNNGNNVADAPTSLDILQRLSTLIENGMDLNGMSTAEAAPPKRHSYSGFIHWLFVCSYCTFIPLEWLPSWLLSWLPSWLPSWLGWFPSWFLGSITDLKYFLLHRLFVS